MRDWIGLFCKLPAHRKSWESGLVEKANVYIYLQSYYNKHNNE